MAIAGERPRVKGQGYKKHPMSALTKEYLDVLEGFREQQGLDIFTEGAKLAHNVSAVSALEDFYLSECFDPTGLSAEEQAEQLNMMKEQFTNDLEALKEYAPVGTYNPVMGLVFPMHKNILMSNIWDKVISKDVAVTPKFTRTMEHRILVTVDGEEIDMFKNQAAMKQAMDQVAPFKVVELTLPEVGTTDLINAINGGTKDSISISTYISAFQTSDDEWHNTRILTKPAYGDGTRVGIENVSATVAAAPVVDTLTFTMKGNVVTVSSLRGNIKAVRLSVKRDTSNGLVDTPTTKWTTTTDIIEIKEASPINTTISPEEIKDINAMYNVDQLTKIMALTRDVLANYKNDTIKEKVDQSFETIAATDKFERIFDLKPPIGYMADFVEWRIKTFMDVIDTLATGLLQVLRDPNMTISIIGRPDIIRKVRPTTYDFQSPGSIGPVELEFERTIVTSDKRAYQFISDQKIENDEIIFILQPRNSERIIYKMYDYQLYVSNEIRNAANPTLPALHAFERWEFTEYQPVQGRLNILHPDGGFIN